MARRNRYDRSPNGSHANHPYIQNLLNQGLDKSQIVKRLVGKGNADQLGADKLRAIGFGDTFIQNHSPGPHVVGRGGQSTNKSHGGGGGKLGLPDGFDVQQFFQQQAQQAQYGQQQSAFSMMKMLLQDYGLDSLVPKLQDLIQSGVTDQASLTLELQQTQEWKTRFAGNEALKQKGLPVLSVGEYLATERSYAQLMKQYGLPEGFYDGPSDFAGFIGNAVSASELKDRLDSYSNVANREDPAVKAQLKAMGMSDGDLLAYAIDPNKAAPLIQRKFQTVVLGAAARRAGVTASNDYAQHLAEMGVTEQQAQQGYGIISESLGALQTLGQIYGVDYTQSDFEHEVFDNSGQAAKKRKRLASQERAAFSGSSGITQDSLRQSTAGQF